MENERDTAALALTEEELDTFVDSLAAGKGCRKLYMSCELLPNGRQAAMLEEKGVQVYSVPEHYYRELEVGGTWN